MMPQTPDHYKVFLQGDAPVGQLGEEVLSVRRQLCRHLLELVDTEEVATIVRGGFSWSRCSADDVREKPGVVHGMAVLVKRPATQFPDQLDVHPDFLSYFPDRGFPGVFVRAELPAGNLPLPPLRGVTMQEQDAAFTISDNTSCQVNLLHRLYKLSQRGDRCRPAECKAEGWGIENGAQIFTICNFYI